jgi:glycine cleavage system transcriptional repressor
MNHFAIITAFGQDRPGIVALMADSLYRLGCNIEDTCMTRLRGEFTMMLMVRLPEGMAAEDLARRLIPYTTPLDLAVLCRAMPDLAATRQTALEIPTFILSVYGADHPGIVAQVARTVAQHQGNITDMKHPRGRIGRSSHLCHGPGGSITGGSASRPAQTGPGRIEAAAGC